MSEHLVHTAILRDSQLLIQQMRQLDPALKELMTRYYLFAQCGCVTVSGDVFSHRLLREIRALHGHLDEAARARTAFVMGWISHRACDRVMKPIWKEAPFKGRGTDVDPNISPFECSIYHEAEAYRCYFADDPIYRGALFPDALVETMPDDFDQAMAQQLTEGCFASGLMAIQTIPDGMADQPRFEEICMRIQKFYVGLERYRRAISAPDPENLEAFVTGINWRDPQDPIIAAADSIRRGEAISPATVEEAVRQGGCSYYAQALSLSLRYIVASNRYLTDEVVDDAWLRDQLDIGKLGPGGLAV